jgi:hypothetical protein
LARRWRDASPQSPTCGKGWLDQACSPTPTQGASARSSSIPTSRTSAVKTSHCPRCNQLFAVERWTPRRTANSTSFV